MAIPKNVGQFALGEEDFADPLAQATLDFAGGPEPVTPVDGELPEPIQVAGLGSTFLKNLLKGVGKKKAAPEVAEKVAETAAEKQAQVIAGAAPDPRAAIINEKYQKALEEQTRGKVRPREVAREEARIKEQTGEFSPEKLAQLPPGSTLPDEEIVAATRITGKSFDQVQKKAQQAWADLGKIGELSPAADEVIDDLETMLINHLVKVKGVRKEAGRSLGIFNDPTQTSVQRLLSVEEVVKQFNEHTPRARMIELIAGVKSEAELTRVIQKATRPGWKEVFTEVWVNGLLSGYKTQQLNAVDGALVTLASIPERYLAEGVSTARRSFATARGLKPDEKSVRRGEAYAMAVGAKGAIGDAFRVAGRAFITDRPQLAVSLAKNQKEVSKIENRTKVIAASNFGVDPETFVGKGVDYLGATVRLPGRGLITVDEFFKTFNFRMERHALAAREAWNSATAKRLKGQEFRDEVANLQIKFTEKPTEAMDDAAFDWALTQTHQKSLGKSTETFMRLTNENFFAKINFPFLRAPISVASNVIQRTPGLAQLSPRFWREMAAGGSRKDIALARQAFGGLFATMVVGGYRAGYITAKGPETRQLREAKTEAGDWQTRSFISGDEAYQFDRFGVYGQLMGLIAEFTEVHDGYWASEHEDDEVVEELEAVATGITTAIAKSVTSPAFAQGALRLGNLIGEQEAGRKKALQELTLSVIPALSGQVARDIDPEMRAMDTLLDRLRGKIPGLSMTLPPRRNRWAEAIPRESNFFSMVTGSFMKTIDEKPDPALKEMVENEVSLVKVPERLASIRLTIEDKDRYTIRLNKRNLNRGESAELAGRLSIATQNFLNIAEKMAKIDPALAEAFLPETIALQKGLVKQELVKQMRSTVGKNSTYKQAMHALVKNPIYKQASPGPEGLKAILLRTTDGFYRDIANEEFLEFDKDFGARAKEAAIRSIKQTTLIPESF